VGVKFEGGPNLSPLVGREPGRALAPRLLQALLGFEALTSAHAT
jgi:hypothetical protein